MNASRTRIALIALIGVLALFFVADQVTSSPAVCGSCHEMEPRTTSWAESPHAKVDCVTCHVAPRAWYAFPVAAVEQSALLGRDAYLHMAGGYQNPVEERREGTPPMSDDVCLACHDVNRKATSGFRIQLDHAEHARRNGSCVSCHVRTAHPLPTRGTPLSLMTQCFTCHGTAEQPEASAECGLCHPSGFDLHPTSHKEARWARGHGSVAKNDRPQCAMCHQQSYCDDCHGLEIPHPAGWAQGGEKAGHADLGTRDRELCAQCHLEKPDLCSMCHHQTYDPAKGNWVRQHYSEVEKTGVAYCFECHSPVYCVRCHVNPRGQ